MPDAEIIARLAVHRLAVLSRDENGVGHFVRIDDGTALKADEIRIPYRRHETWGQGRLDYGAQSFFFQEGDAESTATRNMRCCGSERWQHGIGGTRG